MSAKVIITIGDGGGTEIKVEGCAGPSCQSLTEGIEKALGSVTANQKTPEFYQQQKATAKAGAK